MSEDLAHKALKLWPLHVSEFHLAAHRENTVYKVTSHNGQQFALRLHRPGYHSVPALESEMLWMAALADRGIRVPVPLPSTSGKLVEFFEETAVDILSWLPGKPMGTASTQLDVADPSVTMFNLGAAIAKLHDASDEWSPPEAFTRHAWNMDGLVGDEPFWGRFWDNPLLTPEERKQMFHAREQAQQQLHVIAPLLDYGLIHADPVRENVLLHDGDVFLIDFDDGGFGFRLFDLATVLLKCRKEPGFDTLQDRLIKGYKSCRAIDTSQLPLMLALRAFTYLGWIVPRLAEPWAPLRFERFKEDALHFAKQLT